MVERNSTIELACLGRPFGLGMLYDILSDTLIPGITFWNPNTLRENLTEVPKIGSECEVLTEDSFQEKARAFGVKGSQKLSLIGGLIGVCGAAKYIQDVKSTDHVCRLTLKYCITTSFQHLTMEHLGKGKLSHPDSIDLKIGTHVTTGILYGAEAFFIFERRISEEENKREIEKSLREIIQKIPSYAIGGNVRMNLNDNEKNLINSLNCKFYGDFQLESNPNTFAEAVKLYGQLPTLLGENRERVIAKRVWLYPLHLLGGKTMKIVREISSNLIDSSIDFLDNLHVLKIRATDLMKSTTLNHLSFLKKHLNDFTTKLSEFENNQKRQIIRLLPEIRGGGQEETSLLGVFTQRDSSPFNIRTLKSWVEAKEKEINIIGQFIKDLMTESTITVNTSSLDHVIGHINFKYIVCFSFRLIDVDDPQLSDMFEYLHNPSYSNTRQESQAWFNDPDVISNIRTSLRQFIDFTTANSLKSKHIKFVANEECPRNGIREAALTLYENGVLKHGFIVPSKPSRPYATTVTPTNITLEWADAQSGSHEIQCYIIMYRQCHDGMQTDDIENIENKWNEISTKK